MRRVRRHRCLRERVLKVDLGPDGLERGGHVLLTHHLRLEGTVEVLGGGPGFEPQLRGWCRAEGHRLETDGGYRITAGPGRRVGAETTGPVVEHPPERWGLAARGAVVEGGLTGFHFSLDRKLHVWADHAQRLYLQAAGGQWDPQTAIDWDVDFDLPDPIEDAVVQVMTYLIENETVALIVPSRFLARIHPHFREVMQVLAVQVADEARHIEVFQRRALLKREVLGLSTVGGQTSLRTLLEEPDFALASFLLSVLGEGTFLELLHFLHRHAPDPITAQICGLAAVDEARHVAFGMGHLARHAELEPDLLDRLAAAVHRRHGVLQHTAGLNAEVMDALVLLAAGSWDREAIGRGFDAVLELQRSMDAVRTRRLRRLGFDEGQAEALSALHTRNFM